MTETTDIEVQQDIGSLDKLVEHVAVLTHLYDTTQAERGISRSDAINMENLSPGFLADLGGASAFTTTLSLVNYQPSLESMIVRAKDAIIKAIKFAFDLIRKIINWAIGLWRKAKESTVSFFQKKKAAEYLDAETANILKDLPQAKQNKIANVIDRCKHDADAILAPSLKTLSHPLYWSFFHNDVNSHFLRDGLKTYGYLVDVLSVRVEVLGKALQLIHQGSEENTIRSLVNAHLDTYPHADKFAVLQQYITHNGERGVDKPNSPGHLFNQWRRVFNLKARSGTANVPTVEHVIAMLNKDLAFDIPNEDQVKLAKTISLVERYFNLAEKVTNVSHMVTVGLRLLIKAIGDDLNGIHAFNEVLKEMQVMSNEVAAINLRYRKRIYEQLITAAIQEPEIEDAIKAHVKRIQDKMRDIMSN